MTAVVGILCKDGVVVGSDSSATFTNVVQPTIEQKVKKIDIVENKVIVAGSGQIGLGQRFVGIVKDAYAKKLFSQHNQLEVGRTLSEATIKNFISTNCPQAQYGALLAYASGSQCFLCEFAVKDFQPEWKNESMLFVSIGSGQRITDPFLGLMRRVFWKNSLPSVADATFIAVWTLQHAIDLNTGGINAPIQLSVLRKSGDQGRFEAHLLTDEELQEHMNNVDYIENYLSKYKGILLGDTGTEIPHP